MSRSGSKHVFIGALALGTCLMVAPMVRSQNSTGTDTKLGSQESTAKAPDGVKLTYMDDLLPQMWFPRDAQPRPEWLNADPSERRPMSWALWYSSVARYVAGHKDIMLVVLAKENQTAATRKLLIDAGANIQFELSEIGFFRALAPLSAISKIFRDPSVEEVESAHYSSSGGMLFESFYRPITDVKEYERLNSRYLLKRLSPSGDPALLQCCATQAIFNPVDAVERTAERANSFIAHALPHADLGLEELRRAHPTFDGRGVAVGVYDMFPQVNHPALGEALDLQGRRISKIPDIQLDPSTFTQSFQLFTFHKPSVDESLHFGPLLSSLDSRMLVAEARIDREYADTIKAVFDPAYRRFGFDIDKDGTLGPTEWFRDYRTSPSESVLYTTQYPTGVKQAAVFFLFADFTRTSAPKATFILEAWHGTMGSSVIAAAGGVGVRALGLAPGSQIVPYNIQAQDPHYDQVASSLDQLLSAILAKDVDIVTAQAPFSLSERNSYELTQKVIERSLAVRPKAVFMSSGNAISTIDGHFDNAGVFAHGVTAIGASVGPTIGSTFFGPEFGRQAVADPQTATGPASDGARATLLFTTSRYPYYTACVPGDINLRPAQPAFADRMPNCTWLAWATSGAAPPAAAVAASLYSGLRQRGYTGDSTVVAKALAASAEPLDNRSYDFVAGQVSAAKAWDWLEKNVLSMPARSVVDRSKLSEPFEIRAPIRHEESLRTGRFYSTRGMYDRYFDQRDIGKCSSIWVRSSSRSRSSEYEVTMASSDVSVVLATTRLTGSAAWRPITLCIATPVQGVWSGTVRIRSGASEGASPEESVEQQIPVTIIAPLKLHPGENGASVSGVHFGGMVREAFASVPLAALADDKTLARATVRPLAISREPVLDLATVNGSHGTPQNPLSKVGVQDEVGLLVHTRWLNMPVYPAANFSLPEQRKAVLRPGANESWSLSMSPVLLRDYAQLRTSSTGSCPGNMQAPTVLFRAAANSAVPQLQSACLPEIGAEIFSFNTTTSIDSLLIVKPRPSDHYDFAVFRYHNGIWLPQISSFHSIWKTHEELRNLPPGEWRIFMRRVEPVQAVGRQARKVEPK